jgi:hypothetical protein
VPAQRAPAKIERVPFQDQCLRSVQLAAQRPAPRDRRASRCRSEITRRRPVRYSCFLTMPDQHTPAAGRLTWRI